MVSYCLVNTKFFDEGKLENISSLLELCIKVFGGMNSGLHIGKAAVLPLEPTFSPFCSGYCGDVDSWLSSNPNPPNLCLPSSSDYRGESSVPSSLVLLIFVFSFQCYDHTMEFLVTIPTSQFSITVQACCVAQVSTESSDVCLMRYTGAGKRAFGEHKPCPECTHSS
jgi:hypothetical protein